MNIIQETDQNMERHAICDDCFIRGLPLAGRALALKAVCILTQEGPANAPSFNEIRNRFVLGDVETQAVQQCLTLCMPDPETTGVEL